MIKLSLTIIATALASAFASAQVAVSPGPPATPAAVPAEPLFAFVYRPGPAWVKGKPMHEQQLGEHFRYMQRLQREGRLAAAGPFSNIDGGMALIRAADRKTALALLAADPAIVSKIFVADVRSWVVALGPDYLKTK